MSWALHLLGVGNAGAAPELGAAAVIECDGEPVLMIDAGQEAITAFHAAYGRWPTAVFITHVHMDHVAGLERLFYAAYFDPALRGRIRLYVPAGVMPHLRRRLADYPEPLAEGSVVWTGDTRPIPEVLSTVADEGELVAHDCGLPGNPSHTGIDDLEREYPADLRARCLLYH